MPESDDTPAAMLTGRQRDWCRGRRSDLSDRAQRALKSRARERVRASIIEDIPLVLECLPLEEIVDDLQPNELVDGLRSQVALVYRLARAAGLQPEKIIEEGIEEGRADRVETLYRRFEEGDESLTIGDLKLLHAAGKITRGEERELLQEQLDEPIGYNPSDLSSFSAEDSEE